MDIRDLSFSQRALLKLYLHVSKLDLWYTNFSKGKGVEVSDLLHYDT